MALLAVAACAVRTGGRDLIGTEHLPGPVDRRWLLSLAVVGAAATQLLPAALSNEWLPLACFAVACAATLGGLSWYHPGRRDEPLVMAVDGRARRRRVLGAHGEPGAIGRSGREAAGERVAKRGH